MFFQSSVFCGFAAWPTPPMVIVKLAAVAVVRILNTFTSKAALAPVPRIDIFGLKTEDIPILLPSESVV